MQVKMTRRGVLRFLVLALVAGFASVGARSQVVPSAFGPGDALWVGAECSYVNPSFPYQSSQHLEGMGGFVDFHFNQHLGVEGSARFLELGGFEGVTESSYLAGPRYRLKWMGKFQPYAQGLVGIGSINYPFNLGSRSYLDIAPSGGVNYRLGKRWIVRAEYEYQVWLNSPGFSNVPDHPLRPNGVHVGVAYRLF